jgi:Spy/CpxP family protein refolding chaperone
MFTSAAVAITFIVAAQSPATAPATQPSAPLLSGPQASEDDAGRLTLVRRSFDGTIENLGAEPDAVAIAMLDLTPQQKARYDEVRAARMSAFDQIVRNNYGLVLELASLQGETNPAKRLEIFSKTSQALKPYLDRGSFLREMWPVLTDEQRQQVEAMVAEYRQAKSDEISRESNENLSRRQIVVRERLNMFGQMLRESIERQVGLERENFEMLADELELTQEQRAAAEAIFGPLAIKRFQNIEVTRAEQSAAFAEFNKLLSAGQKQKAFGILLRQYQQRSATATAPTSQPAASQPAGMN